MNSRTPRIACSTFDLRKGWDLKKGWDFHLSNQFSFRVCTASSIIASLEYFVQSCLYQIQRTFFLHSKWNVNSLLESLIETRVEPTIPSMWVLRPWPLGHSSTLHTFLFLLSAYLEQKEIWLLRLLLTKWGLTKYWNQLMTFD